MKGKSVCMNGFPIFAYSIRTTFLRKKYYGFGRKKYSAETNCMQRSALSQAGFSFLSPSYFQALFSSSDSVFSTPKKGVGCLVN